MASLRIPLERLIQGEFIYGLPSKNLGFSLGVRVLISFKRFGRVVGKYLLHLLRAWTPWHRVMMENVLITR